MRPASRAGAQSSRRFELLLPCTSKNMIRVHKRLRLINDKVIDGGRVRHMSPPTWKGEEVR